MFPPAALVVTEDDALSPHSIVAEGVRLFSLSVMVALMTNGVVIACGFTPGVIAVTAGLVLIATPMLAVVPLKQPLTGVTVTGPPVVPQLTVIAVVPCPPMIVAPAGTVQE
jgi:hypothetical protein